MAPRGAENQSFGAFAPDPLDRTRHNLMVFAQNVLQPLQGLLIVTSWRYDDDSRFGSYNKPAWIGGLFV
jgi:hypothetical protein